MAIDLGYLPHENPCAQCGQPIAAPDWVEAGPRRSRHFNIRVVDLPSVKQIKVTYHYPPWTGLKDSSEDSGGDLELGSIGIVLAVAEL